MVGSQVNITKHIRVLREVKKLTSSLLSFGVYSSIVHRRFSALGGSEVASNAYVPVEVKGGLGACVLNFTATTAV